MSLFEDFQQGQIITNPRQTYNYRRVLVKKEGEKKKTEAEKKAGRKAISNEMKAKLTKEEFNKRRQKAYYERQREDRSKKSLDRYYRKKEEEEILIEEIYKDVYNILPEPINYDKYYLDKFREDDIDVDGKYRFSWWSSKLIFDNRRFLPKYKKPIKIYGRKGVNAVMNNLLKEEGKAYQLLLPHLEELQDVKFRLKKYQTITKYPLWDVSGKLVELCMNSDIAPSHICNVLSAIQRGKYIASEAYLGRTNFIMGDVVVTQTGNKFQPCLENNIPWLTPATVEDIHSIRMKWRKKKGKERPPIYMLQDAYLIKIPVNEWETYYYLIPT